MGMKEILSLLHAGVDGEVNALTEKTTLVDDDVFLVQDSAASYASKKVKVSNLPAGGGGGGGAGTYTETVGDTSTTSFDIDHDLGSTAVQVAVIDVSSGDALVHGTDYTWLVLDSDGVRVVFSSAPDTDDARIVVLASGASPASASWAKVITTGHSITSAATTQPITWTSAPSDTDTYWSAGSPTRLTVPADGPYVVHAFAYLDHGSGADVFAGFWVNGGNNKGAFEASLGRITRSGGSIHGFAGSDVFDLAAGDYVQVVVWVNNATRAVRSGARATIRAI